MEFCNLVTTIRREKFKTARAFYEQSGLKQVCSYFYYSQIEANKLPSVEISIAVLKALDIDLRRGLYAWVRSQMPDDSLRALFMTTDDIPKFNPEHFTIDKAQYVNVMQAKLLEKNPLFWEIITYTSHTSKYLKIDSTHVFRHFKIPLKQARKILQDLVQYGLLSGSESEGFRATEWMIIPNGAEFQKVRGINFQRALKKVYRENNSLFYKATITRYLTKEQQKVIEGKIISFLGSLIDVPENDGPPQSEMVSIGIFAGKRGLGNA